MASRAFNLQSFIHSRHAILPVLPLPLRTWRFTFNACVLCFFLSLPSSILIKTQVLILGAAKDTAVALRSTLLAASQVQGRPETDSVIKEMQTYGSVSFRNWASWEKVNEAFLHINHNSAF